MNLVHSFSNDCVAASLAMLFGCDIEAIKHELFSNLMHPFPAPWDCLPKVPDMNVICDWAWGHRRTALVPFEYDPYCSPDVNCPTVPVWPISPNKPGSAEFAFSRALGYGSGLLEGVVVDGERGHMCAWDGNVVYDPRGYIYSRNIALDKFDYRIRRFWLAVRAVA
jgi:hypothetical protein